LSDPFELIYSLTKRRRYSAALNALIDSNLFRLRAPFSSEGNHAWYCVGDIAYRLRHFEIAKEAFRRSLKSRPDDWEALWALGNCYSELSRPRMAERYFRKAIAIAGREKPQLTLNLANVLFDQSRYKDSLVEYRKVVQAKDKRLVSSAKTMVNRIEGIIRDRPRLPAIL
jgi:tetratricopeptide (TPR) repeat protein